MKWMTFFLLPTLLFAKSYESTTLPNGLEVVIVDAPKVPLATLVLTFKAGSMTETPTINGLTHVWEHMFFRGNKKIPDEAAFQRRTRQLGINTNAFTSTDQVSYHLTLPSVFLEEGIEFMADAIKTPLLTQHDLNAERVVVLDEFDRNASSPEFDRNRLLRHIRYGSLAYRRDPLGDRKVIETVNRETLLKIREQVFVPQNGVIMISGDVRHDMTLKLVDKYLGDWQGKKGWKPVSSQEMPAFPGNTDLVTTHRDAQNFQLSFHFQGPSLKNDEAATHAADVLSFALSHRNSPFYKTIIDSGLSLGAALQYRQEPEVSELYLGGSSAIDKAKDFETALIEEIPKMAKPGYFSSNILEDVRHSLEANYLRNQDEPSDYVMNLSFWWGATGLDYFEQYLPKLKRIREEHLIAFVRKYLLDKPYIRSTFLNPEDAKKLNYSVNAPDFLKKFSLKPTQN